MRVVAGIAGGLPLKSPKGVALRPTQDRIKQVIFSSLGEALVGAEVLDLYAGSGGLGIEALSRGARSAVFVDQEKQCIACVEENLRACQLKGKTVVQNVDDFLQENPISFDFIFADPPYEKNKACLDKHPFLSLVYPWLKPHGTLVWEHYGAQIWQNPEQWKIIRHRRYGETGLTFLRKI